MTIPNRDAQLESAMAEYLALLESGQQLNRAAFLSAHLELAPELEPILIRIEKLQGASRQVTAGPVESRQLPVLGKHTRIGEFEIVQVLGRGGMGVVYEAIQTPLNRRVALKVLPADAAIDVASRARFLREARMAALLHHPNIVPVHAVGEVDGVQFYAMQFIDGQPLDAVIQVLRQRTGMISVSQVSGSSADCGLLATGLTVGFGPSVTSPSCEDQPHQSRTYLSQVVRVITEAAMALEYAHEHNIIHRDIKPGNLLLDVRGHIWLNDFGLAKLLINDGTKTTTGRVGTVRYMSPEMAEGRKHEIDERTDVYGLGLVLYELLTLRPAYSAQMESELLSQILNHEPTQIREYNPAVAVDLETIVHKAIAKVPSDRYASAQAFADDLTRYRNGLPVIARRLTRWQRTQRWAKRHRRALLGAGLAVTIGVISGLAVSTYFIVSALHQTQLQRDRTALREQELLTLVEQVNQSEFLLQDVPNAEFEQRNLVRQVKSTLCTLADDPDADRTVRWAAFRACIRLVEIESRHRRPDDAAIVAFEAHSRIMKLLQDGPHTRKERIELARAYSFLAGTFAALGHRQTAIEYYRIALELLESLDAEKPNDTPVLNQLGQLRELIAELLGAEGKIPDAIALSRRGLEVNEFLAKQFPRGHPQSYIRLVLSHSRLARFERQLGQVPKVEGHLREAVKNHHLAVREAGDKANPIYTFDAPGRLGAFYLSQNRLQEARTLLQECIHTAEEYQEKFPSERNYPNELVWCYLELGRVEYLEGHHDQARLRFLQTIQLAKPQGNHMGELVSVELLSRIPMTDLVDWSVVQSVSEAQLQKAPSHSDSRLTLALSQLAHGDLKSAEVGLQVVLKSTTVPKPIAGLAEYSLATCQAKRGDMMSARATFATAEMHNWHQFATDGSIRVARKEAEEAIQKASR